MDNFEIDIFDEGAMERERQRKIESRRREYSNWARGFLGAATDALESWPVFRSADGVFRCGYQNCNVAIDRAGHPDAIRFHLFQMHRDKVGVIESGVYGENAALDRSRNGDGSSSSSSDADRLQDQERDS